MNVNTNHYHLHYLLSVDKVPTFNNPWITTDTHMRAIRAAGIAVACAVHGVMLLDASPSKAVDLNSGAINASHFALSINYQPVTASNDVRSKAEDVLPAEKIKTVPSAAVKPEAVVEKVSDVKIDNKVSLEKQVTDVKSAKPTEITQQEVAKKHPVQPKEKVIEEPTPPVDAAPTQNQNQVQGVHEAVIAKPLFAAPPEPPSYPKIARKRGQQGTVWIEVLLAKTGQQIRAEIHQSSGVSLLDRAALTVVQKWQFIAHQINGVAVASRIRIPVEFSLD
ncbi:energy transducer TonB [Alkalimarinus alittae]|uniref:Energy transducer TonB n=1 Tax=Alkalimarinus alittae TaxID=2961619 RepID=A0ABY6N2M8_9ALTE|nr:energy transducer TonB [Alkalimarinus alittae]UZE96351.1 energy transducer TonB [Alkalimarinus alittae]